VLWEPAAVAQRLLLNCAMPGYAVASSPSAAGALRSDGTAGSHLARPRSHHDHVDVLQRQSNALACGDSSLMQHALLVSR
jgi:hypothetical protein